ncbi:hypothetical protein PS850_06053 [Pseudomonas fluorescens]|nr:hypothetical protein PS903_02564 [Pseudomonas fluorescens]VVP59126.1 hypothetical protein PS850_06053 [Pseudomonas fluorescens]
MNDTCVSHQTKACLKQAFERNHQLFSEAQRLRCAALNILDRPYLNPAAFSQYQEQRRQADLKYEDAMEHLRSLMAHYHYSSTPNISANIRTPISLERSWMSNSTGRWDRHV